MSPSLPPRALGSLLEAEKSSLLKSLRGNDSLAIPAILGHKRSLLRAEPGLRPSVPCSALSGLVDDNIKTSIPASRGPLVKENEASVSQALAFDRDEQGPALLPKPTRAMRSPEWTDQAVDIPSFALDQNIMLAVSCYLL